MCPSVSLMCVSHIHVPYSYAGPFNLLRALFIQSFGFLTDHFAAIFALRSAPPDSR